MIVIRGANLTLSFLLELGMLAALGYWGYHASDNFWISLLLGVVLPVAAAIVWAIFLAPKASIPLGRPWHLLLALALFALATAALFSAGQTVPGTVYGVLAVVNQFLIQVLHQ